MSLSNLTARKPLIVSPLLYPWSISDQSIFGQIFSDDEFYECVERYLSTYSSFRDFFGNLHEIKEFLTHTTSIKFPRLLAEKDYSHIARHISASIGTDDAENFATHVRFWASILKQVAYDAMHVCFQVTGDPISRQQYPSGSNEEKALDQYMGVYRCVEGVIEANLVKAFKEQIDSHPKYGSYNATTGKIELNLSSQIVDFVHIVLKAICFEFMRNIIDHNYGEIDWASPEPIPMRSIQNDTALMLAEIELGIIANDPEFLEKIDGDMDDDEIAAMAAEIIKVRVNKVLNTLGSPKKEHFMSFAGGLIDLCAGAKAATFGFNKRRAPSRSGPKTTKLGTGRKLHRAPRRLQAMAQNPATKKLVDAKVARGSLTVHKGTKEITTKGGEVYVMMDCTGSTLPYSGQFGLANLLEAISFALIDAAKVSDRNISLYYYHEGTAKIVSVPKKATNQTVRAKKLQCIGNAANRENNEITSFNEIFHDIRRHSGKKSEKQTLIFFSDGGMLTGGERSTDSQKLKLMLEEWSDRIDVVPVLISGYQDPAFQSVFGSQDVIHVKNKEDFGAKDLKDLVATIRKYDPAFHTSDEA